MTALRKVTEAPVAVTVADFDAWVAGAEPREALVYAKGPYPPHDAPGWVHARELFDDGVITLSSRRAAPGQMEWLAIRLTTLDAPIVTSAPVMDIDEANPLQLVLREIRRAATFKLPCPSNADIAKRCGLKDGAAASYRIRQLVASGVIRIEAQGPGEPRVATIVGTGKTTARAS